MPECNPFATPNANLITDPATQYMYCCNPKIGARGAHCGGGFVEFTPDCRQFSPNGQFMQPYGCVVYAP